MININNDKCGGFKIQLWVLSSIVFTLLSCSSSTEPEDNNNDTYPYNSIHLALGVPSDNTHDDDFLIIRHQYALSYNKNKGVPNWVSWELNSGWYGDVERYSGNFITETYLPEYYTQIKHSDYTNSGFDRGHMVRSEERTKTVEDNKSTFIMTNIIPQTPDLNRGVWLDFEYYCEELCKKENKELFVIAGPIIHTDSTIKGEGKVAYPDSCFKIVVVLEKGQKVKDITKDTKVYAVVMPNIEGISKDDWEKYKTTVDRIQISTGYDFLSLVPDQIENEIEKK